MRIGMVGLGRMGANMTKRLVDGGHQVVAYDRNPETVRGAASEGAEAAEGLEDLVRRLQPPRAVWVMVPAGDPTVRTVDALVQLLEDDDVIIDGGNSPYRHAVDRSAMLRERGIWYVDAGVSGGVWGLKVGYCLMVGGDPTPVGRLEPVFRTLAPEHGFAHVGPSGAGHYAKMIHNGIEYGMLQAYAEGFALLEAADEFGYDLHQVSKLWNHGSVIRSWLLELAELALEDQEAYSQIRGYVEDSGEGRWTVQEAVERAVPAPVITASLFARFASRDEERHAARIVAALRNQFGGHRFFTESAGAEAARDAAGGDELRAGPEGAGTDPDAIRTTDAEAPGG